jgi:8-oxo-dGTP diphosphatase
MTKKLDAYVVGFLYDEGWKKVLLIEKKRPKRQAGKLNGVGGRIEEGETPQEAMTREFNEEASVLLEGWSRKLTLLHEDYVVHFFLFKHSGDRLDVLNLTDERLYWHDPTRLPSNTIWNLRWLIPLMLDSVELPITVHDNGTYDFSREEE